MDESEPPVTQKTLEAYYASNNQETENPGLLFEKFALDWLGDKDSKKNSLINTQVAVKKCDKAMLKAQLDRWKLLAEHCHGEPFEMRTDWRVIAGLGRKGSLEVGFTFHRYGFAYLPGSSVKGLARAWGLREVAVALKLEAGKPQANLLATLDGVLSEEENNDKFDKAWKKEYPSAETDACVIAKQFRAIFGTTDSAGKAIFFDALPSEVPKLELDIINPHYPDYYQGKTLPTDSQNPVPIPFLAVAAHQRFQFAVGWRGSLDDKLHEIAKQWLKNGLQHLGAGAKTNAGYGYFVEYAATTQTATAAKLAAVAPKPKQVFKDQKGVVENDGRGGHRIKLDQYQKPRSFKAKWSDFEIKEAPKPGKTILVDFEEYDNGELKFTRVRKV